MLDLLIIGSSAAGASAGVYAARRNLNFKIVTFDTGGEVALSGEVANFPGWGETTGIDISEKFQEHLKLYNVKPDIGIKITNITKQDDGSFVTTGMEGEKEVTYESKTVIITTGVHPRHLNIPGEKEYKGMGVTYCTTCDGPLFKDKVVATIGGGNSGLESALMLDGIASKVYILNKYAEFKGEPVLIDKVNAAKNVEILPEAMTKEIFGEQFVTGLKYDDKDGKEHTLDVQGVFVHIGVVPNSELVPEGVDTNDFGEIKVDKMCATNVPGLFAAGDVTDIAYKQIVIASGQGACAALSAVDYLNKLAH